MRSKTPFKSLLHRPRHMRYCVKTSISPFLLVQRPEHHSCVQGLASRSTCTRLFSWSPRPFRSFPRRGRQQAGGQPFRESRLHIIISGNAPPINPASGQKTIHQRILHPIKPARAAHDEAVAGMFPGPHPGTRPQSTTAHTVTSNLSRSNPRTRPERIFQLLLRRGIPPETGLSDGNAA